MSISKTKWISVGGLILIGILIGSVMTLQTGFLPASFAESGGASEMSGEAPYEPVQSDFDYQKTAKSFTRVSEVILPTVVSISTSKVVKSRYRDDIWGPFFRDFFGREPREQQQEQRAQGLGSGVLVRKDGYILTNNHVIEGADDIRVTLHDRRSFEAELVGRDPLTDIAVIKVKGDNLPAARLGDSDELEIGEWVLAVGNPLELTSTVTAGIVSAKSRNIGIIRDENARESGGNFSIENFIQTDAAINPGNSGGALVNLKAEVIGINTAIATRTGTYVGYGFAVPVNLAKKVMNDLIRQGYVTRAYVGIGMESVTEAMAQRFGMKTPSGVMINQVMEDTPAREAGLKSLDIILSIDGREMNAPNQVQNYVALKNPGDVIEVKVLRDGKNRAIKVKLGQRDMAGEPTRPVATDDADIPDLGLKVQDLTDELRSRLEIDEKEDGVLVSSVDRYGAAAEARLARGDLITGIENRNVSSVQAFRDAIKSFDKGQVVIFHVKRQNQSFHAFVKIPK